jgi:hypothetical protein
MKIKTTTVTTFDIENKTHRMDMIKKLLNYHIETTGDFWDGCACFVSEISKELSAESSQNIQLVDINSVFDEIDRSKPFG